jgi:hypothetical protein
MASNIGANTTDVLAEMRAKSEALQAQAMEDYRVLSQPHGIDQLGPFPDRLRRAYHVATEQGDWGTAQLISRELAKYQLARRYASQ